MTCTLASLSVEMSNARLGDARLSRRLGLMVDALTLRPSESFPDAFQSDAALEAAYRFFNNDRVTSERVLEPHSQATLERAVERGGLLVVHDTTEFKFEDGIEREDLGPLRGKGQGFFGHFALALGADGLREPLGVLGMRTFVRSRKGKGKRTMAQRRRAGDNELDHWRHLVDDVEERISNPWWAVHVMDRQADSYELLASMIERNYFVVRAAHADRVVHLPLEAKAKLRDAINRAPAVIEREVRLSPRRQKKDKGPQPKHLPVRKSRVARLAISAVPVTVKRPGCCSSNLAATLQLNVVRVFELDTPPGELPVEWLLLTNLPIGTPEQVAIVVDHYRCRWVIEEFNKALKTGCSYQQRHLESGRALLNALATLAPVAWRLLLLRYLAQHAPDASAAEVLTPTQVRVLVSIPRLKLRAHPTVREAMLAVASLGGHLKNNGEPGWQVLGRGFYDLLLLELGWSARTAARRREKM